MLEYTSTAGMNCDENIINTCLVYLGLLGELKKKGERALNIPLKYIHFYSSYDKSHPHTHIHCFNIF